MEALDWVFHQQGRGEVSEGLVQSPESRHTAAHTPLIADWPLADRPPMYTYTTGARPHLLDRPAPGRHALRHGGQRGAWLD